MRNSSKKAGFQEMKKSRHPNLQSLLNNILIVPQRTKEALWDGSEEVCICLYLEGI